MHSNVKESPVAGHTHIHKHTQPYIPTHKNTHTYLNTHTYTHVERTNGFPSTVDR